MIKRTKPAIDAVEILHRRFYEGKPARLKSLEEARANEEIARRCRVDPDAVRRWRQRFAEKGVAGVGVIAEGRGRKAWLPAGTVAEVVRGNVELYHLLGGVRDPLDRELVLVDFKPVADSKIGELAARFDVVVGLTPAEPGEDRR